MHPISFGQTNSREHADSGNLHYSTEVEAAVIEIIGNRIKVTLVMKK